jgi:GT2 family glycosyltransferase
MSLPFTAARARNSGFKWLVDHHPEVKFVQFVDGDCEVVANWLETAVTQLNARPDVAVVSGRRRERYPDASVYNRLCDIEWDTPIGEAQACGGDAMMRVEAFRQVTGYDPRLIAGEEPELCVRLRQRNWRILRVDADMTLHDAAITSFCQWWKRATRAGHAYAEGVWLHGRSPQRHYVRPLCSIFLWAVFLPVAALAALWPTRGFSMAILLSLYAIQWGRIWRRQIADKRSQQDACAYATFTMIAKFAGLTGSMIFALNLLRRQRCSLIEYKRT